jgi:hypothetical protein
VFQPVLDDDGDCWSTDWSADLKSVLKSTTFCFARLIANAMTAIRMMIKVRQPHPPSTHGMALFFGGWPAGGV